MSDPLEHIALKGRTCGRPYVTVMFSERAAGRAFRDNLIGVLVSWLGRTRLAHVAVEHGGHVWNPLSCGDGFYDVWRYLAHYPGLQCVVWIPIDSYPLLSRLERRRRRIWPSIIRVMTGGRTPSDDCVYATVCLLRSHGIMVPKRTVTPDQLLHWLVSQGFLHASRTPIAP